jgi:hypothetical protein
VVQAARKGGLLQAAGVGQSDCWVIQLGRMCQGGTLTPTAACGLQYTVPLAVVDEVGKPPAFQLVRVGPLQVKHTASDLTLLLLLPLLCCRPLCGL